MVSQILRVTTYEIVVNTNEDDDDKSWATCLDPAEELVDEEEPVDTEEDSVLRLHGNWLEDMMNRVEQRGSVGSVSTDNVPSLQDHGSKDSSSVGTVCTVYVLAKREQDQVA